MIGIIMWLYSANRICIVKEFFLISVEKHFDWNFVRSLSGLYEYWIVNEIDHVAVVTSIFFFIIFWFPKTNLNVAVDVFF